MNFVPLLYNVATRVWFWCNFGEIKSEIISQRISFKYFPNMRPMAHVKEWWWIPISYQSGLNPWLEVQRLVLAQYYTGDLSIHLDYLLIPEVVERSSVSSISMRTMVDIVNVQLGWILVQFVQHLTISRPCDCAVYEGIQFCGSLVFPCVTGMWSSSSLFSTCYQFLFCLEMFLFKRIKLRNNCAASSSDCALYKWSLWERKSHSTAVE